jgi:hypothetical protein
MKLTCLAILSALAAASPVRAQSAGAARGSDETTTNRAISSTMIAGRQGDAVPLAGRAVAVEASRQEKPADVAGAWALTVETGQGTGTPSVTFKQDGEKLTGLYSSQVFGEQQVTGSIKGNAITFSFTGSAQGTTVTVTYSGTVEKDTMKGKVILGDLGEGTFTGKRK